MNYGPAGKARRGRQRRLARLFLDVDVESAAANQAEVTIMRNLSASAVQPALRALLGTGISAVAIFIPTLRDFNLSRCSSEDTRKSCE